jgi:hypothetical protein
MRIWFALLVAPVLALADQSVAYALAGWSCAHGHSVVPHVTHAAFLLAVVVSTVLAWSVARTGFEATRTEGPFSTHRHDAMSLCALALGAYSAVVIVAFWIPQWMLSPCLG